MAGFLVFMVLTLCAVAILGNPTLAGHPEMHPIIAPAIADTLLLGVLLGVVMGVALTSYRGRGRT